ncbi:MAG: DUF1566 domain-containing protein [bacterium]
MPKIKFLKLRKRVFPYALLFVAGIGIGLGYKYYKAQAEISGESPDSESTSYIKTIYDSLFSLSYGSDSAGSWGDWGAYWNRLRSAGEKPFNDAVAEGLWNGTGAGSTTCAGTDWGLNCYTKAKGGVDDYNNGGSIPTDSYQQTWTTCSMAEGGNNGCGTGRAVAERQDPNTELVWGPRITTGSWFTANNCIYPNGLENDADGGNICDNNGERSCVCIKHTGIGADTKTGCEVYDDGNWRLPTQKELMQAYIDGSWGNLLNAGNNYWSATTQSSTTRLAWYTSLFYGGTVDNTKTNTGYSYRCVR